MRKIISLFSSTIPALFWLSILVVAPEMARADTVTYITETVEYVGADDDDFDVDYAPVIEAAPVSGAAYGPFRVVNPQTVEVRGTIDSDSPARFKALLDANPGVKTLRMVECPGSEDDDANLALARMVRKAGLATHVPANGSIRSGGVELFLAGVSRTADKGAQFGVHSWRDSDGYEATDYPPTAPVHGEYLRFYKDMGLADDRAEAFYAFTNTAAPSWGVHYMTGGEIAKFALTTH